MGLLRPRNFAQQGADAMGDIGPFRNARQGDAFAISDRPACRGLKEILCQ